MDEYYDYESDQNLIVRIQNKLNILSNCIESKSYVSKIESKDNTSVIWFNTKERINEAIRELDRLII